MFRSLLKRAYRSPVLNPLRRLYFAGRFFNTYYRRRVGLVVTRSFTSPEVTNFTYDLTGTNCGYLAHLISVVSRQPLAAIQGYIDEVRGDMALHGHINSAMQARGLETPSHAGPFGRRLGWYALVRALKPGVVVETGVDRGHGSVLLCAALLRNAQEGRPGRYFGTDINPQAGWLLSGRYAETGKILYGDSIASLSALNETIGLFINDSDHSADYEEKEYHIIAPKLAPDAILIGDNAHVTDRLMRFAEATGRDFLYFQEEPKDHWYPGGGIGLAFPRNVP